MTEGQQSGMSGRGRLARPLTTNLYPVAAALSFLFLWHLAILIWDIPAYLLPSPVEIFQELFRKGGLLFEHLLPTLRETLEGFSLAVVIGLPLAVVIAGSKLAEKTFYPLIVAMQAVPKIAVAPLFVVWLGFGELPKALTAFLICFFPIIVDSVTGLRSSEPELIYLLRSMGARPAQIFLKVRIPHALPHIFAGLKVSMSLAIIGALIAEFVGADVGLGYLLMVAIGQMQTALLFAAVVVLSVTGIVLYYLVQLVEHKAIPWHVSLRKH